MKTKPFTIGVSESGMPHTVVWAASVGQENMELSAVELCWWYWMLEGVEVSYSFTIRGQKVDRKMEAIGDAPPLERALRPALFIDEGDFGERYGYFDIDLCNVTQTKDGYGVRLNLYETDDRKTFFFELSPPETEFYTLATLAVKFLDKTITAYLSSLKKSDKGAIHSVTLKPRFYEIET